MNIMLTKYEKERLSDNIAINREKMNEAKRKPCHDCGLHWHPYALTFDHVKRSAVTKNKNAKSMSAIISYQPDMFQRMLNVTHVVCYNCHKIRELKRDIDDPKFSKANRYEYTEMLEQCYKGALIKPEESGK